MKKKKPKMTKNINKTKKSTKKKANVTNSTKNKK